MLKKLATLALTAGSLLLGVWGLTVSAASANPIGQDQNQPSPPKKPDASTAGTKPKPKPVKKGAPITPDRLSTNETTSSAADAADAAPAQAAATASSSSTTNTAVSKAKASSESTTSSSTAGALMKSKSSTSSAKPKAKQGDKIEEDRMSTRGLKAPAKTTDTDKNPKPEAKPSSPPDASDPK
jgi:hypothetical protein